jgi:thymidine phosphorylase
VGFVISVRPGQQVEQGEPLASIYARSEADVALARAALEQAVVIGGGAVELLPLVTARVTASAFEALAG